MYKYLFYDIQHLIMLERLKLLRAIADGGYRMIISEFRLAYYSGIMQRQLRSIIESGTMELLDQGEGAGEFLAEYADTFAHAGNGVLLLMHLCKTENAVLIVEGEESLIAELADFFSVPTMTLVEFYTQTIKDERYRSFLLNIKEKS